MTDISNKVKNSTGRLELKFSTVVFLDFEATGLSHPRVTELCLLAVNRADLAQVTPRITNKLVLCVDPQKPVECEASFITGLYNDSLELQQPLGVNTVELIKSFLLHQTPPVCLLAHNGNGFDFPLLVSELARVNQRLDGDLFCADSLEAFRELDGLPRRYNHNGPSTSKPMFSQQTQENTPPTKLADSSVPPALKRRIVDNTDRCNNCNNQCKTKACCHDNTKVRKKLDFGGIERASSKDEQPPAPDSEPVFSQGLEDSDLLMALEQAERAVENNSASSKHGQRASLTLTERAAATHRHCAPDTQAMVPVADSSPVNISTEMRPCLVTAGSGYHVANSSDLSESDPNTNCHSVSSSNSEGEKRPGCLKDKPNDNIRNSISCMGPYVTAEESLSQLTRSHPEEISKQKSYKLEKVFIRTFGRKPAVPHSAEADCQILQQIMARTPGLLDWIEANAIPLATVTSQGVEIQ